MTHYCLVFSFWVDCLQENDILYHHLIIKMKTSENDVTFRLISKCDLISNFCSIMMTRTRQ